MNTAPKTKGRWIHRLGIHLLTFALGVLVFWLLGFLVEDIESLPGPDYAAIERELVDPKLIEQREQLEKQIAQLDRQLTQSRERQQLLSDSTRNLQQTINQLLELQRLSVQKGAAFNEADQANLGKCLQLFQDNQQKYQELSQSSADLLERKQSLENQRKQTDDELARQRMPARAEFERQWESHRLRLAAYQLGLLTPLLAAAGVLLVRQRGSIYFPVYLAVGAAALVKVGLVVHEYFPSRYFKYILIVGLLLVVGRILISLIRLIAHPKASWLLRQYREAYERFLCPACEYPIRTGPRRYLFWTRRTVNKVVASGGAPEPEECYTCPACGTRVFEPCSACGKVRHSLMPNCMHCGASKAIE